MGAFTQYLQDGIINHVFGSVVFTPVTLYLGLLKNEPAKDGSEVDEVTAQSYQRITTTYQDWASALAGSVSNVSRLAFQLACEDWGKVTHFGLFDSASGGKLLVFGQINEPVTIKTGAIVSFTPGQLSISID